MKNANSIEDMVTDLIDDLSDAIFGNERQADLRQYAQRYGFHFRKKVSYGDFDFTLKSFDLFSTRKKKKIRNVLTKEEESIRGQIRLFDCRLDGSFGKKQTTVAHLRSDAFELPKFLIRPQKTTERLTNLFVHQDIDLSRFPAFEKLFTLKGDDPVALSFLVTAQLADLLTAHPDRWIEGRGKNLLVYSRNRLQLLPKLPHFQEFAQETARILLYDRSNEYV